MKLIYNKYVDYKMESMKKPNEKNSREEWLEIMREENLFLVKFFVGMTHKN
jgi:hypothetical protein